ncbi:MAG: hypothetical protein U0401_23540 [Anaerolineae bacterium]
MEEREPIQIDPELWLAVLLPQLGDPAEKRKLIESTARNTGIAPEKVEEIFRLLAQTLLDMQRSN